MGAKGIFSRWLVTLFLFLYSAFLFAASLPIFLIVPLTSPVFNIGVNDTAVTVSYRVTNQTSITRTLTIKPIPGATQTTGGAGVCSAPFTLARNQSCILVLTINGSQMPSHIVGGPVVCKTRGPYDNSPDSCLCAQPAINDRLDIRLLENTIISLSPSTISLIVGEPPVPLRVFNTSRTITAVNVHAIIPASLGVIQDSSQCASLAPRSSCTIFLTAGTTTTPTITVPVQGDNTNTPTFRLKIGLVRLQALPHVLNFQRNTSGTLTIHNLSTTTPANNIRITLPAGSPIVIQSTTCPTSLAPGNSCTVTFTSAANTDVTPVEIEADNSSLEIAYIKVNSVVISVTPSSLSFSSNQGGVLTVTNNSLTEPANNIGVTFHDGSPAISFQNNCPTSLAPGTSCTIFFNSSTAVDTIANISGSNTNLVQVPISVNANVITATPSTMSFINQHTGTITVTNTSPGLAQNITVTNDPSSSPVSVVSNTCTSLLPGASCTITLTSSAPFPQTTLTIKGTNTTSALVSVVVPQVAYIAGSGPLNWCTFSGSSAFDSCNPTAGNLSGRGLVVNNTNTFVYIPSGNSVIKCAIANDGSLPASGCVDSGAGTFASPSDVAMDSTGTIVFIVDEVSNNLTECGVNSDGSLSCAAPVNPGFAAAYWAAVNNPAFTVYVANQGLSSTVDYCPFNFVGCGTFTVTTPGDNALLSGITVSPDVQSAYISLQGRVNNQSFISTCGLNDDGSFSSGSSGSCNQQSVDINGTLCGISAALALNYAGNAGYVPCGGLLTAEVCPVSDAGIGTCIEAGSFSSQLTYIFGIAITH